MILPVLHYPDPLLERVSVPVREVTPELRRLAADMVETMYARDGIGLAAPQVGEAVRLVVMDVSGPDKREDLRILLNPVLTLSGPERETEEGCLSVPDYRANVTRHAEAAVRGMDLDGNPVEFAATDMLAICAQHECDHLDGILFIDHISRLKRGMLDRRLQKKSKA
jgi:peptide deformylase